jgi:hypothetical protein
MPSVTVIHRRFGRLLTFADLLLIAAATLMPLPRQVAAARATHLWCLICGDHGGVDVVLNTILFIPLGLALRLMGWSPAAAVAMGAGISLTVESLQLAIILGRDGSLSDLVTNTLGSLIGTVLARRLPSLLNPTRGQAAGLAFSAGLIWLGIQGGTAFLLQPWVPSEPLRGEWARQRAGRTPFDGKVTSTIVSGVPVTDGSIFSDSELHARLGEGRVHLELDLISGRDLADWSPVFEVLGSHGPILAVEAAGTDLVFGPPARSYSLRLRSPTLRLPQALASRPGSPLQLAAGEREATLWASWTGGGVRQSRSQALSPSLGWSLLVPFNYAYGPEVYLLTALWIAGLLAPIGYWSARAPGGRSRTSALALLLLTGLGVTPLLAEFPPVHWSEWLAGAVGLGSGWASQHAAAYFGRRCDSPFIKEFC